MRREKLFGMIAALGLALPVAAQQVQTRAQATGASTGSAQASTQKGAVQIASGTKFSAELLTTLDAEHARPGQRVVARVTKDVKQDGRTIIRKGSRLIGHVTRAEASAKGEAGSTIEVVFDRLVSGRTSTELNAVVTSILSVPARPLSEPAAEPGPAAAPAPTPAPAASQRGGGLVGGAVGAVGATVNSTLGAAGQVARTGTEVTGNTAANAGLGSRNRMGAATPLADILVGTQSGASAQASNASVFSTRNRNLRLESGTQLELEVTGQATVQAQPHRH